MSKKELSKEVQVAHMQVAHERKVVDAFMECPSENVARKCEINRILYGNDSLTKDKVDEICRDEVIGKKHGKIGF